MRELTYLRPTDPAEAVARVTEDPRAAYLAGGSNLVDHLKLGVADPEVLVDVRHLRMDEVTELDAPGDRSRPGDPSGRVLRVGATVRNSDLAAHPVVRRELPAVARALLAGASGQIRHQATTAGNLLQRTRCVYFTDVTTGCNKREPGSGCSALEGYDRYNAILGASDQCVAVHPSDLAVALTALDAVALVLGAGGERRVPLVDLHRLPDDRPEEDSTLHHGDLVTAVEIPLTPLARTSTYYKARDRASFAFALVSVAAALRVTDGVVDDVRLAWGGVAHKPWRARACEAALRGGPLSEERVRAAVAAELAGARTSAGTAAKPAMVAGVTTMLLTRLADAQEDR